MKVGWLAVLYGLATAIFAVLPVTTSNTIVQGIYLSASSAFLSIVLGLIAVNVVLNSSERKAVARPLFALIAELAEPLHNDLFVRLGRDAFGREKFDCLIDAYQKHHRSPDVFSPGDLDELVGMIMSKKSELMEIYGKVESLAADMARIIGWGYDPAILTAILSTRACILTSMRWLTLGTPDTAAKRSLVENYFDSEAACSAWARGLAKKLGQSLSK